MLREQLLRPREVASRLGVSRSTVYRWFWEGKLNGVKLMGGPVRILESSVQGQLAEAEHFLGWRP
ncbi:MAG: helix-turn-helix domain-containing protein [Deltaproteobacteria bacterium]|nr:helix-turn-helix domain-containing protein [Deltaproteobacteria bacterium]